MSPALEIKTPMAATQVARAFRQAYVPTPDLERAWRTLAARRVLSIPRVALTPAEIEALAL